MSAGLRILVVGVGSMFGDDQAGWLVAGQLTGTTAAGRHHPSAAGPFEKDLGGVGSEDPSVDDSCSGSSHGCALQPHSESEGVDLSGTCSVRLATVPFDILDWMEGIDELHLIDACRSEQPAGTVRRLDWAEQREQIVGGPDDGILQLGGQSSHDFGLAQVLQLAEVTQRLPPKVIIWAIDGQNFTLDHVVSPAVSLAADSLLVSLRKEIGWNHGSMNRSRLSGTSDGRPVGSTEQNVGG